MRTNLKRCARMLAVVVGVGVCGGMLQAVPAPFLHEQDATAASASDEDSVRGRLPEGPQLKSNPSRDDAGNGNERTAELAASAIPWLGGCLTWEGLRYLKCASQRRTSATTV